MLLISGHQNFPPLMLSDLFKNPIRLFYLVNWEITIIVYQIIYDALGNLHLVDTL